MPTFHASCLSATVQVPASLPTPMLETFTNAFKSSMAEIATIDAMSFDLETREIHLAHPARPVLVAGGIDLGDEVFITTEDNDEQQIGDQRHVHQRQDGEDDSRFALMVKMVGSM